MQDVGKLLAAVEAGVEHVEGCSGGGVLAGAIGSFSNIVITMLSDMVLDEFLVYKFAI